jgi:hypothetical protein
VSVGEATVIFLSVICRNRSAEGLLQMPLWRRHRTIPKGASLFLFQGCFCESAEAATAETQNDSAETDIWGA